MDPGNTIFYTGKTTGPVVFLEVMMTLVGEGGGWFGAQSVASMFFSPVFVPGIWAPSLPGGNKLSLPLYTILKMVY